MRRIFCIFASTALLTQAHADAPLYNKVEYPLPAVPDSIRLPKDRADFAVSHFWDAYEEASAYATDTACVEQALANFTAIARLGSRGAEVAEAVELLTAKAARSEQAASLLAFAADKYLDGADSPVRDRELYAIFARAFANAEAMPDWIKAKYGTLDRLMALNAVGTKASDSKMQLRDGTNTSLRKELGRDYTVVLLYDPGCEHCDKIMRKLADEAIVEKWISAGMAKIIAVDIRPAQSPEAKVSGFPASWIAGTDATGIEDGEIYYVPETPAIYLLGPDGTVLLKEADATDVLEAIWMGKK